MHSTALSRHARTVSPSAFVRALFPLAALSLTACGALPTVTPESDAEVPATIGERVSGYSYVPLDPLAVKSVPGDNCSSPGARNFVEVLDSLPDISVRIAIGEYNASGELSFGPASMGVENSSYQVVLDFVMVDVANVYFDMSFSVEDPTDPDSVFIYPLLDPPDGVDPMTKPIRAVRFDPDDTTREVEGSVVVIPVYVGVGLRLTANVNVLKGNVNLSSLGVLAAETQGGRVSGSLTEQTLGISGEKVATLLPLPTELNPTTIQNAILSMGGIKAILHNEASNITPRVVGLYNPIGKSGQKLINAIVSELAKDPVPWVRRCDEPAS